MRTKMTSPVLLLSACATPALVNYFHNPNANAVAADDTTKNTDNPAINGQLSALDGGGKNQSAGQIRLRKPTGEIEKHSRPKPGFCNAQQKSQRIQTRVIAHQSV